MIRTGFSWLVLCCAVWIGPGCAGAGTREGTPGAGVAPYLGVYRGSFDSALTEDPADDLNHNPCDPQADQHCLTHHAPLRDILLALRRDADGAVTLAFYRSAEDLTAGRGLDLLGRGCDTRLGPLASFEMADGESGTYGVALFPLRAGNRMCLGKLRPVSRHQVRLELHPAGGDASPMARVVIDRNVRDANYLYVVEDGVRRRVKIDLDNVVREDHQTRYRVCIEDDLGEYERCVLTDREFRSFALPVPLPGGGIGINYTWWQELRPRLARTRGLYVVERYVGRFEPVTGDGS